MSVPCYPSGSCFGCLAGNESPRDVANFLSASGGKQVVYLKDYADLRRFCVDALKWADEEDSLMPELADEGDFVFLPIRKVSCWLPILPLVSATNEIRNIIRRLPNKKGPNCFIFRGFVPSTCCTMPCSTAYCRRSLFLSGMAGGCCTRTGIS